MAPDASSSRNNVGDYEVTNKRLNGFRSNANKLLLMTAMANLEWSRGYTWYVELDDVPFPFQRNGVLGLPVTDITYELSNPNSYEWKGGVATFSAPQRKGITTLNMTMYDDELGTIFTFFERWYNEIYNSRAGVLPVVEAAKAISIYKLNAMRNPITRYAYRYNMNKIDEETVTVLNAVPSRELLIYPSGPLQEQEKIESAPRTYNIQFNIVNEENADYGNPAKHEGTLLYKAEDGKIKTKVGDVQGSFLSKAARYF